MSTKFRPLLIVLLGTLAFSQTEAPPDSVVADEPPADVLILDFQGVGITGLEAMTLTMRLASELGQHGGGDALRSGSGGNGPDGAGVEPERL